MNCMTRAETRGAKGARAPGAELGGANKNLGLFQGALKSNFSPPSQNTSCGPGMTDTSFKNYHFSNIFYILHHVILEDFFFDFFLQYCFLYIGPIYIIINFL